VPGIDEARLSHAIHEGIEAGRKIERRLWLLGVGFYFGIPFATWLLTLLAMIIGNVRIPPQGGVWTTVLSIHREAKLILAGPFHLLYAIVTGLGFAVAVVGVVMFGLGWLWTLRRVSHSERKPK
jgi:hypothetical protein